MNGSYLIFDKYELQTALGHDEICIWRPLFPLAKEATFDYVENKIYTTDEDKINVFTPPFSEGDTLWVKETYVQHDSGAFAYSTAPGVWFLLNEEDEIIPANARHEAYKNPNDSKNCSAVTMSENKSRLNLTLDTINVFNVQSQFTYYEMLFMKNLGLYETFQDLIHAIEGMNVIKDQLKVLWDRRFGRKYGTWWKDNHPCYCYSFSVKSKLSRKKIMKARRASRTTLPGEPLLEPLFRMKTVPREFH